MTFYGPVGEQSPRNGGYLADDEGKHYTARARHWSEETRKQHEEMGCVEDRGACADQLKALCESD